MSNALDSIDIGLARETIASDLALHPDIRPDAYSKPTAELVSELLRACLWARYSADLTPVTTLALLNAAERSLLPWAIDVYGEPTMTPTREIARSALDELELLGDVAVLPGGRWVPSPLRGVRNPGDPAVLLVGGAPTRALPIELRANIFQNGGGRHLIPATIAERLSLPSQTRDEWCARPTNPLDTWTRGILADTAVVPIDQQVERATLYAPRKNERVAQFHRWRSLVVSRDGRYLLRTDTAFGGYRHAVAEVQRGRIRAVGALPPNTDVRRLCYGLDALAEAPTSVRKDLEKRLVYFTLSSEVPQAEQRLLTAFGRIMPNASGAYYPRIWRFPENLIQIVEQQFLMLGISIS